MPRNPAARSHFAHVLYAKLIAGTHHLPTVARNSGLSDELLYKLCRGERAFSIEHLAPLHRATRDLELFTSLVSATDLGLVVTEAQQSATSADDTRTTALRLGAEVGRVQLLAVQAEADGLLTDAERIELERQIDELERKAESLRQVLRARRVRVVNTES